MAVKSEHVNYALLSFPSLNLLVICPRKSIEVEI